MQKDLLPAFAEPIQRAAGFATFHHYNQFRNGSGIPYIIHPLEVLKRVAGWGITNVVHPEVWQLCLLHDTVEDTDATLEDIEREFGPKVAEWVRHMTFRDKFPNEDSHSYQEEKSAHLACFAQKPVEVLVVKVADRICNVYDFLAEGNYAVKYHQRASGLWEALRSQEEAVITTFGGGVWHRIEMDRIRLNEKIDMERVRISHRPIHEGYQQE
jgi:(p)ppGpp synthase/HD superfamily hydrolase